VGVVPVELLDQGDSVWLSADRTRAWLDAQGLSIGAELHWGPISRCKASGDAWALREGIVRSVSYGSGTVLDTARMRELGIRAGWGGGIVRERLEGLGVGQNRRGSDVR
jgi:hypothetical protein